MIVILYNKVSAAFRNDNAMTHKPAVWVEYSHKDVADFVFWRHAVNTDNFDIVYYLDRPDTPPSEEITKTIESMGLKWIDAHFFSMFKVLDMDYSLTDRLIKDVMLRKAAMPAWYRTFESQYYFYLSFYSAMFRKYNVKILIQHQEASWVTGVQAEAMELSNGIMMGVHWSNYPHILSTTTHLVAHHVFFAWGKMISDFVGPGAKTGTHIIPSGIIIGPDGNSSDRTFRFAKPIEFKLAVFDSSAEYRGAVTLESLSEFYLKIISLLEENTGWGAIIKSKCWTIDTLGALPHGEQITARLKALVQQQKVYYFVREISPVTAASLADLSVCYGLNSAGIVAGVYGHKAVHWDCSGWVNHPFYKDADQKFIYPGLEDFEKAIVKASRGDKSIGDFSKWQQKFNYFNDFEAPRRVGGFVQTFMDEAIKTGDGGHSLGIAVRRYIESNNVGDDFFCPAALKG
ncbi:MAG: hypothetical protein HQL08_01105 [Nitrospirae bacterium]|nr:hypothetical protein [Nitrospirota bacterium]